MSLVQMRSVSALFKGVNAHWQTNKNRLMNGLCRQFTVLALQSQPNLWQAAQRNKMTYVTIKGLEISIKSQAQNYWNA